MNTVATPIRAELAPTTFATSRVMSYVPRPRVAMLSSPRCTIAGFILCRVIKRSLRYVEELSEGVQRQLSLAYTAKDLLGWGLRQKLREGYTRKD